MTHRRAGGPTNLFTSSPHAFPCRIVGSPALGTIIGHLLTDDNSGLMVRPLIQFLTP